MKPNCQNNRSGTNVFSGRHPTGASNEVTSQEQADGIQVASLRCILDGLVENRPLFERGEAKLDEGFLETLKDRVLSTLRRDKTIADDACENIIKAFDALIDHHKDCLDE